MQQQIKVVGNNGQISLGKQFAGKMVLIDQVSGGTWIIKCGSFVPEEEQWLYRDNNLAKLEAGLAWVKSHPPVDNFDELAHKIEND